MKAIKKRCEFCCKFFWATRKDNLWCSDRCKRRTYRENVRFEITVIPRSGINGITFNRFRNKWEVRIPAHIVGEKQAKYVGSAPTIQEGLLLQREILGETRSVLRERLS